MWNNIVEENNGSIFLKESFMSLLEEMFHYEIWKLQSESAVFPIALQKSIIFGNRLVSLPFAEEAGALGDAEEAKRLVNEAVEKAKSLNVNFIEVRDPKQPEVFEGFERRDDYCTFLLNLGAEKEELWGNLEKRTRNDINKAKRSELEIIPGGKRDITEFYKIYLITMKRLGSPPQSRKFFEQLFEKMPDSIRLVLAKRDNKIIAGQIHYYDKEKVNYTYNCALAKYRRLRATDLMLWETILWAQEKGIKKFDFGRTRKDSGVYFSKKGWGGEEKEVSYYYKPIKKKPEKRVEVKYKWVSNLWAKLIPGFLARLIGPWLIKQVG